MNNKDYTYHVREDGCRGRLMIECPKCKKMHSFYQKMPSKEFVCRDCGERTELNELRFCRIICKCGASYKCLTNVTDQITDGKCSRCQAPVTIEWNKKTKMYITVRS